MGHNAGDPGTGGAATGPADAPAEGIGAPDLPTSGLDGGHDEDILGAMMNHAHRSLAVILAEMQSIHDFSAVQAEFARRRAALATDHASHVEQHAKVMGDIAGMRQATATQEEQRHQTLAARIGSMLGGFRDQVNGFGFGDGRPADGGAAADGPVTGPAAGRV